MQTNLNHKNGGLRICIDRVEGECISGRVFSQRLTAPLAFPDLGGLLLQLEELLEKQGFPQSSQHVRSFTPVASVLSVSALPEHALSAQAVAEAAGERCTLVLTVLTRRNATWQGYIDWLDGGQREQFSSGLEFLSLVEERLSAEHGPVPLHLLPPGNA